MIIENMGVEYRIVAMIDVGTDWVRDDCDRCDTWKSNVGRLLDGITSRAYTGAVLDVVPCALLHGGWIAITDTLNMVLVSEDVSRFIIDSGNYFRQEDLN